MTARILLIIAAAGFAGCSRHQETPSATSLPAIAVRTATVEAPTLVLRQPVAGTVQPFDQAVIAARVMGTVSNRPPPLGAMVTAGQTLISIEAAEIAARLAQARATMAQLDRELAQATTLQASGAAALEEVRSLSDRRRAAEAAVAEAEALWSYTNITAPFAGTITRRFVEQGDLAAAGSALLELEGTDRFRVSVAVPESLDLLALGIEVPVEIGTSQVAGRVAELSRSVDPSSRTRLAIVDLPQDATVHSGQFVRVLWPAGTERALLVPDSAVIRRGQMEQVFTASDGHARLRIVRTGGGSDGRTRILSGLDSGETVILSPPASLRDGQPLNQTP
jgi:RND family efflux transporter MFP subunit